MYQSKRDRMLEIFHKTGFKIFKPQGSYSSCATGAVSLRGESMTIFSLRTGSRRKSASPAFRRVFYQDADKHLGKYLARFSVCKKDETLDAAAARFSRLGKL